MSQENLFDVKSCEQFFGESRFIIQSYLIAAFISDNGLLNMQVAYFVMLFNFQRKCFFNKFIWGLLFELHS